MRGWVRATLRFAVFLTVGTLATTIADKTAIANEGDTSKDSKDSTAKASLDRETLPHVDLDSIRVRDGAALATLRDGSTATLTLKPELQDAAAKLLSAARPLAGAAILIDVDTGRVVALASFRRDGAPPGHPLITGAPTASLFKLVTTASLFDHSRVTPDTKVCWDGGERRIDLVHLDPPRPGEGTCSKFFGALGHSRNAVYAQLVTHHLTRANLLETAERLGFNQELPFDAKASFGELTLPYNDVEFARASAGFVGSTLTPLGAAHLTHSIALGGMAARLRLVANTGEWTAPKERENLGRVMSANAAWRLSRMMEVTVHSGTSLGAFTNEDYRSYLGAIRVAGKTGTLQRNATSPTTSWFTGFAPSRKPKVVVTVLLQNGPVWRRRANEVARDLLRVYFAGAPGVTSPFEPTTPAPTSEERPTTASR